jgi:hypothetical protein
MTEAPDPSILPVGSLGLVAPMSSLGFALNPGLAMVYDEVIILLPAQTMVFTFQQRRAVEAARELPYDEAAGRGKVKVFRLTDLASVELVKPFTGYRLAITTTNGEELRWIMQKTIIDEVRSVLADVLGDRFTDSSTS